MKKDNDYYAKHRDEIRARNRARYKANPKKFYQQHKKWLLKNRERVRIIRATLARKKSYGITSYQFDAMLQLSNNKCEVCGTIFGTGKSTKPSVDHDHKTGKVRGLLCMKCNSGLGFFNDDPARVMAAISYLKKHDST